MRKRILGSTSATVIALVLVVCLGGTAVAAWLVTGSGSGFAAAMSLDQADTPSVAQVGSSVTVS